jgi:hypothetical protein
MHVKTPAPGLMLRCTVAAHQIWNVLPSRDVGLCPCSKPSVADKLGNFRIIAIPSAASPTFAVIKRPGLVSTPPMRRRKRGGA